MIYRKVSGGTRSDKGSKAYEQIYSIFYTTKLRNNNFIEDTQRIMKIYPRYLWKLWKRKGNKTSNPG